MTVITTGGRCRMPIIRITDGAQTAIGPPYFATGRPQGLREYKSKATGVANLAGRAAAALAMSLPDLER